MLQQTQVKTMLPYWERWMRELPDIATLARAKPEKLHKLWEGLGYYTRVRNLQKAARLVLEKHQGRFPEDFEQVLALPGIGRYTAGAISSIAFNQPKPVLDGNVMRVLSRVFGIGGNPREVKTNSRLWRIAGELVRRAANIPDGQPERQSAPARAPRPPRPGDPFPAPPASAFNQALMELGALVCLPRQPRCDVCPIAKHCVAYREDCVQELPGVRQRVRATPRRFAAFVAQQGKHFLVRQRPAGIVNAYLWEFPNVELEPEDSHRRRLVQKPNAGGRASSRALIAEEVWACGDARPPDHAVLKRSLRRAARRALGLMPKTLEPLCVIKHSITRYRITLEVFRVAGDQRPGAALAKGRWVRQKELSQLAFASAHKQILKRLEDE